MIINPYRYPSGGSVGFPIYLSATGSVLSTAGLTIAVNMPASVNSGDLLIMCVSNNNALSTISTPSGWTSFLNVNGGGCRIRCFYKVASGTEGGSTENVTQNVGTAQQAAVVYHIQDGSYQAAPVATNVTVSGPTATFNPPNLSPAWGAADTLWIALFTSTGSVGSFSVSAYPFVSGNHLTQTTGGTGVSIGSAYSNTNAANLDPGPFTLSSTQSGIAVTMAVRPV